MGAFLFVTERLLPGMYPNGDFAGRVIGFVSNDLIHFKPLPLLNVDLICASWPIACRLHCR
jgi:hypothetical protein